MVDAGVLLPQLTPRKVSDADALLEGQAQNENVRREVALERVFPRWLWNSTNRVDFPFTQQVMLRLSHLKSMVAQRCVEEWRDEVFEEGGDDLGIGSKLDNMDRGYFVDFWQHILETFTKVAFDEWINMTNKIVDELVEEITTTRRQRVLWQLFCVWDFNGNGTIEFDEIEAVVNNTKEARAPRVKSNLSGRQAALTFPKFKEFVTKDLLKNKIDEPTFFRVVGVFLDRVEKIRRANEPEREERRRDALNGNPRPADGDQHGPPGGKKTLPKDFRTLYKGLGGPGMAADDEVEELLPRTSAEERERRKRFMQRLQQGQEPVTPSHAMRASPRSPARTPLLAASGALAPTTPSGSPRNKAIRGGSSRTPVAAAGTPRAADTITPSAGVRKSPPSRTVITARTATGSPVQPGPVPSPRASAAAVPVDFGDSPPRPPPTREAAAVVRDVSDPVELPEEPPMREAPAASSYTTPRQMRTTEPGYGGTTPRREAADWPRSTPNSNPTTPRSRGLGVKTAPDFQPSSLARIVHPADAAVDQDWENQRDRRENSMTPRKQGGWGYDAEANGDPEREFTDQRRRDRLREKREERSRRLNKSIQARAVLGEDVSVIDPSNASGRPWSWEHMDQDKQELHRHEDWSRNRRLEHGRIVQNLTREDKGWGFVPDSSDTVARAKAPSPRRPAPTSTTTTITSTRTTMKAAPPPPRGPSVEEEARRRAELEAQLAEEEAIAAQEERARQLKEERLRDAAEMAARERQAMMPTTRTTTYVPARPVPERRSTRPVSPSTPSRRVTVVRQTRRTVADPDDHVDVMRQLNSQLELSRHNEYVEFA